ncbi:ribonuclease H-like domain-containing protein [Tanacetum coccineum]
MGVTQLDMTSQSSRRTVNVEETSSKAMLAIDGAGFDWSYMADDEVPTNMALMAFSDSEVHNDKTCSKTYLKSFETLKTQLDDLRIEFNKSEFNLANYKIGDISYKDSEISMLKSELEKLKQEKESNQLKIENFDNASKSLDKLIGSQIPDKSRKGLGFVSYNAIPSPPTGLFSLPNLDLSNSGLEEFQQPEFEGYGPKTSKNVSEDTSNRKGLKRQKASKRSKTDRNRKKTKESRARREIIDNHRDQSNSVKEEIKEFKDEIKSRGIVTSFEAWRKAIGSPRLFTWMLGEEGRFNIQTTNLRNEITNFRQIAQESFSEAWERFKELLRKCPHHGFSLMHQLDTFYNSLSYNDQDSLNSAAEHFLYKSPNEGLLIIENKAKVRCSRNAVMRVSTNAPPSSNSSSNFEFQQMAC